MRTVLGLGWAAWEAFALCMLAGAAWRGARGARQVLRGWRGAALTAREKAAWDEIVRAWNSDEEEEPSDH